MISKNNTLSANIVKYLQAKNLSQREIAQRMNVTESFISHVVKGNRNFSIEHLEKIAEMEDMTLPELLANATPVETVPEKHRKSFELLLEGLKASNDLRSHLRQKKKEKVVSFGIRSSHIEAGRSKGKRNSKRSASREKDDVLLATDVM
jgi:transcriptional regulator with XRE-family HTH domain